ncbi:MAG: hypothetical protein AAF682_32400, partial [Planctomycetota bacterium]
MEGNAFLTLRRVALRFALAPALVGTLALPAAAHDDLHRQIERVSRRIQADPDVADLRWRRADLHRRHRDFAAARSDLAAAGELAPAAPEVELGWAELLLDEPRPARRDPALRRRRARSRRTRAHHG